MCYFPWQASFHYQNGGPRSGNPLSGPNIRATFQSLDDHILKARDKAQWIDVHRLLLLRALMSQVGGETKLLPFLLVRAQYTDFLGNHHEYEDDILHTS